ncbi:MAG: FAD-binding protein [Gammaproteobacteria bacterium]|nr:FAD-binding protein [Gammaproteobacteria bacterium]
MGPRLTDAFIGELSHMLGERMTTNPGVCEQHGHDESYHASQPPDAVVFPIHTEEVQAIAAACQRGRVPMIPYGVGTSLEGQIAAPYGGLSIDMSRMDRIVEVNSADLECTVEAGVKRRQLNDHLRDAGLFFSVDPGADATFGGMAATRASGTNAVRYGTMRDNVLGLTVVLADGRVVQTGGHARKSAAGYDLTRLFVGSEGTLGIIASLTVRLHGRPETVASAVCGFTTLHGAVDTVIATIQLGIPVARIELLDEVQVAAVNRYTGMDYEVVPTLFLEFHGTPAGVADQTAGVSAIAAENGGRDFQWTTNEDQRRALWRARHDVAYACRALRPGCEIWPTDVCVPISKLAECILETRDDIRTHSLVAPIVGHVGDGNFHVVMVIDPSNGDELRRASAFNDRLVKRALRYRGTITGEHGIGLGKRDYLQAEHGAAAVAVMREIKRSLDPHNLMNPGKVFASPAAAEALPPQTDFA